MQRNAMLKGLIISGLVVAAALGGGIYWMLNSKETIVIDADRTIDGNYAVGDKQRLVIANGATLTVTGDMSVSGEVVCENGAIQLRVGGEFRVQDTLRCVSDVKKPADSGIIVSAATFNFERTSSVVSDGSIQMVDRPDRVLSPAQAEQVFATTETNAGTGQRVGPLSFSGNNAIAAAVSTGTDRDLQPLLDSVLGVKAANAQGQPPVVIRGNWQIVGDGGLPPAELDIQTPNPKIKKVLVYFNFGEDADVQLQDFSLKGPDGHHGNNVYDTCNAVGGPGQDAMRFNVQAARLRINNFKLILGSGGDGGIAKTKTDCESATATGGAGGKPGNFKMIATQGFEIAGSFEITPGKGGDGGQAEAYGKNAEAGCPGKNGGEATARGGKGGDSLQVISSTGTIGGMSNITVGDIQAGHGGAAIAKGGNGGAANACGCAGGAGGKATATGGAGGVSKDSGGAGFFRVSAGGNGGNATATPGVGGAGGSCGADKKGGNGGNGGAASASAGKGGIGGNHNGEDGEVVAKAGANGGNGGDGCTQGTGGAGGSGEPVGAKGTDGKITCEVPKKKIKVISVGGHYIPVEQVHLANPDACSEKHWHGHTVTATDGTKMTDPNPGACGFCTESQCPIMEIEVPDLKAEIRFRL